MGIDFKIIIKAGQIVIVKNQLCEEVIVLSKVTLNTGSNQPLLIVLSGPSGVGKDTVIQIMKERGLPFHFVVTATTRPPRPEETKWCGLLLPLQG